jgi:hypothetical protein
MRGKFTRYAAKAAVLAAVLVTAGMFGSVANAQSDYQGKFTLPYEVQWGKASLQPGTYVLTFTNDSRQLLVIRSAKSERPVALEPENIREDSGKGESALLIRSKGGKQIVHSLRISELGQTFVYDPALAHPHAIEEANNLRAIPVLTAKR